MDVVGHGEDDNDEGKKKRRERACEASEEKSSGGNCGVTRAAQPANERRETGGEGKEGLAFLSCPAPFALRSEAPPLYLKGTTQTSLRRKAAWENEERRPVRASRAARSLPSLRQRGGFSPGPGRGGGEKMGDGVSLVLIPVLK